jgi:hypothetical protein
MNSMPFAVKLALLGVVLSVFGYPQYTNTFVSATVSNSVGFTLPVVACGCIIFVYIRYRKTLSREHLGCVRMAMILSAVLVVSIIIHLACTVPFIGVTRNFKPI